ncbi:MAG TPA: PEGA domain-containing protein, partial [Polyangia bacterium]
RAFIDRRSDLFSLGAVLYEMLVGRPLRTAGDNVASWQQVASGLIPPVRRLRPDLSPALERLLNRTLAPDPRDRFADARAFIDEARAVLEELERPRNGETAELQHLLKTVLPPGTLRPARQASRVIRLQSEIFGVETAHALGADLTVPGTDLQGLGLVDRSAVTSIASLESLRMSQAESSPTPPPEHGDGNGEDVGMDVAFTPPPVTPPPPSLTPPLPIPAAAALEWPRPPTSASTTTSAPPAASTAPGAGATRPAPAVSGPVLGRFASPGRSRGEPRRSAAGQIEVEDEGADIHDDPTTSAREDGNRIIAAWPSLLDRPAGGGVSAETAAAFTPPLGSLGASPPVLPYTPPGTSGRGTPAGGVQAPAPNNPPFPPSPSAPLSANALPPAAALPDPATPVPSPVGTMTLPYAAPRERINTPPLSALVGEAKGPSRFPHTLTGGTQAPLELRPPPPPLGAPTLGPPTPVAPSFFAPPPPAQPISPLSSLAPHAIEAPLSAPPVTKRGAGARLVRGLFGLALVVGGVAAVVHFMLVPLPVLAVWQNPARLSLRSEPSGAMVSIDGRDLTARTPTFVEVTRDRAPHEVTMSLAGYDRATQTVRFDQSVDLEAAFVLARNAGAVETDGGVADAGASGDAGAPGLVAGAIGGSGAGTDGGAGLPPGLPAGTTAPGRAGTMATGTTATTGKSGVRKLSRRAKARAKNKAARQRRAAQRGTAAGSGR